MQNQQLTVSHLLLPLTNISLGDSSLVSQNIVLFEQLGFIARLVTKNQKTNNSCLVCHPLRISAESGCHFPRVAITDRLCIRLTFANFSVSWSLEANCILSQTSRKRVHVGLSLAMCFSISGIGKYRSVTWSFAISTKHEKHEKMRAICRIYGNTENKVQTGNCNRNYDWNCTGSEKLFMIIEKC